MKKIPGLVFIISIIIIAIFPIILLFYFYGSRLDQITLIFLGFITLLFAIGSYFSIIQQLLIDKELSDGLNTIENRFSKILTESNNENLLGIIKDYHEEYDKLVSRYFSAISSVSSLLVTAGLIGTIFGLIISMGGLKTLITSSGDNSAILGTMVNVLSGVDVSFYTTLFGSFLGGIILRINLIIHEQYFVRLSSKIKLKWLALPNSSGFCKSENYHNLNELKNLLLMFRKLHIELSKNINNTNKSLEKFSYSLEHLSKMPVHNKLSLLSDKIEEQSKHISQAIVDIAKEI